MDNTTQKKMYVDDSEQTISEEEMIYWSGKYDKKDRSIAMISILATLAIIAMLIGKFDDMVIFLSLFISFFLSLPFFLNFKKGKCKNYVFVTEKKLLAYLHMVFWFRYDEVLHCKIRRGVFDLMFGTGTVVVTVIHTWVTHGSRRITKRAEGTIVIKDLHDPESFRHALMKAKKDSGL